MFTEKKQNFFNSELEHQIQICYHTIKLHCRVSCSKFMCESKHPPLALRFISTPPPHFKDLFMIFPVGHFIMTPPHFRKMSTPLLIRTPLQLSTKEYCNYEVKSH